MSQIKTKFIADEAVTAPKIGSGAASSDQALFADGSGGAAFRSIVSGDIPTLNQSTTGTAANITDTSNATLTTLSALTTASSLAISGSQVSGGTFGAINGSALTNLAAANLSGVLPVGVTGGSGLSIATSQLTGQVSLAQLPSIGSDTILGNNTGGSAVPSALSVAQVNAILPVFTSSLNGLAPLSGGGTTNFLRADGTWAAPSGTGTVTSVALSDGSASPIYSISGSPVTGSGTLTFTLANQAANTVFAGPSTGSAAQPVFRSLVAADIPNLSATYVTQSEVGAASGVASLDGGGKVPLSQLPSALMEFQGNWNPNTNTPALVDGTGTTGFTYWVSAADAGPVSGLNDPSMVNFQVGDLVIYNGTAWVLTTPAAGVSSVNGAQGAVTVNAINQLTGDVTTSAASGSQSKATSLVATSNATLVTLSALTTASTLASVGTITSGTWNATTIAIAHGGTGQTSAAAAYNALSPMTTTGDLEYESGTNTASRLAIGSTGQVLTVVGGVPAWAPTANALTVTEDVITLVTGDISNQYVDIAHPAQGSSASINSISLNVVGGPEQQKAVDYTVSLTGGAGGVTRITFAGDLATGGAAALVSGDILMIKYAY